ncbi:MAG: Com family DNA-binding transcriptional regulator [Pontibacterium sp.]
MLKEVRCTKCAKLLAKADYTKLEIKCPRCGRINQRATSTQSVKEHAHGCKTIKNTGQTSPNI